MATRRLLPLGFAVLWVATDLAWADDPPSRPPPLELRGRLTPAQRVLVTAGVRGRVAELLVKAGQPRGRAAAPPALPRPRGRRGRGRGAARKGGAGGKEGRPPRPARRRRGAPRLRGGGARGGGGGGPPGGGGGRRPPRRKGPRP